MSSKEFQCRRAWVTGRVQGVGFRAATAERARSLGVRGYAANLSDGRVEVVALGHSTAVRTLLEWLEEGPEPSRVRDVTVREEDPEKLVVPLHFEMR